MVQKRLAATVAKRQKYIASIDGLVNNTAYSFKVTGVYAYDGEGDTESSAVSISETPKQVPARQMEDLGRGLVAIEEDGHVFVSWRLLGTEPNDLGFNLYRNGVKLTLLQSKPAPTMLMRLELLTRATMSALF